MSPVIHLPGMGHTWGPPTDAETGATAEDTPECVCGCPLLEHAEVPDMPCTTCNCDAYTEDYF